MGSSGDSRSESARLREGMIGLLDADVAARTRPPLGRGVMPER